MASDPLFHIIAVCNGGSGQYCRTSPPHPHANSNGLYPLHRVIMENHLGRLLAPSERIRHKDGDTRNNYVENLILRARR